MPIQASQNTDMEILITCVLLLVFSAFDTTAKAATYIGLFLLLLVVLNAWQSGTGKAFLQEMFTKP